MAVAPMLLGVVPFGLVAGASPVDQGLGKWAGVGFSTIMFAGASQLAAIDVLGQGGSALVAIFTAWTINLRLVLYSASLAPFLTHEPTSRRLGAAYVLTDQAYAVSVTRWARSDDVENRLPYYLGASLLLWVAWQASTVAGILLGEAVPEDVQLDFTLPLVFIVMLVPVLTSRPAVVAALAGGFGAVAAAEAGAGPLSVIVGCALGIAAGAVVEARTSA